MTVHIYNTAPVPTLPAEHPARLTMRRGNALVPRVRIATGFVIHQLSVNVAFPGFVAACLNGPKVFPPADPPGGLRLNIVRPGREHPSHFDTNEFAISLHTRGPPRAVCSKYGPGIRSAGAENLADVRAVITGAGDRLVRRLRLRPGDLQLFRGRVCLHRSAPRRARSSGHSAILSYSQNPGVVGRLERTHQLFGRLTTVHVGATRRSDSLLD